MLCTCHRKVFFHKKERARVYRYILKCTRGARHTHKMPAGRIRMASRTAWSALSASSWLADLRARAAARPWRWRRERRPRTARPFSRGMTAGNCTAVVRSARVNRADSNVAAATSLLRGASRVRALVVQGAGTPNAVIMAMHHLSSLGPTGRQVPRNGPCLLRLRQEPAHVHVAASVAQNPEHFISESALARETRRSGSGWSSAGRCVECNELGGRLDRRRPGSIPAQGFLG